MRVWFVFAALGVAACGSQSQLTVVSPVELRERADAAAPVAETLLRGTVFSAESSRIWKRGWLRTERGGRALFLAAEAVARGAAVPWPIAVREVFVDGPVAECREEPGPSGATVTRFDVGARISVAAATPAFAGENVLVVEGGSPRCFIAAALASSRRPEPEDAAGKSVASLEQGDLATARAWARAALVLAPRDEGLRALSRGLEPSAAPAGTVRDRYPGALPLPPAPSVDAAAFVCCGFESLRTKPAPDAAVVAVLHRDDELEVLKIEDGWATVRRAVPGGALEGFIEAEGITAQRGYRDRLVALAGERAAAGKENEAVPLLLAALEIEPTPDVASRAVHAAVASRRWRDAITALRTRVQAKTLATPNAPPIPIPDKFWHAVPRALLRNERWFPGGSRRFGWAVAGVGDIDRDGRPELVAGDPDMEGTGAIFVVSPGGQPSTRRLQLGGAAPPAGAPCAEPGARLGLAVAAAGDVNGDGVPDVVVGAPAAGGGSGRACVLLGAPAPDLCTPGHAFDAQHDHRSQILLAPAWAYSGSAAEQLGTAVMGLGDVNGDGFGDLAVGAPGAPGGGRVLVFLGTPAGPSRQPAFTLSAAEADSRFGAALGAADLDGDGFADVIIGAPGAAGGTGSAFLHLGSTLGPVSPAVLRLDGPGRGAGLGAAVAGVGDVNGDGFSDAMVGGAPGAERAPGRAMLLLGGAGGPQVAKWSLDRSSMCHPTAIAGIGDFNGDGFDDVLVASRWEQDGDACLFLGSKAGLLLLWQRWRGEAPMAVAAPGDMNGDGLADVAVSFVDPNPDAGQLDELDTGAVNFLFGTRGSPRDLRLRATAEGMRQVILGAALRRSREEFEAAVRARSDITIGPCDSEWVPTIELYEPGTRFWRAIESALKTPVPEDHRLRRLGDASGKTVFELLADGSGLLRVDSFSVATGRIRHPRECVDCPPCSSTEGAE